LDKITRKDLKTDKFAAEVTHSLEFVAAHRRQSVRYGGAALVLILLGVGIYVYRGNAHGSRQADLTEAMRTKGAVITASPQSDDPRMTFPSLADKDKAIVKAFQAVISKHPGSDEASVAHCQLGTIHTDEGKLEEAEKEFTAAMTAGSKDYASAAKLSLAQIYQARKKYAEAEKLLKELIDSPTVLVSKEQATFALIRVLAATKPAEARKMLEPMMKDERPVIARNASALIAELPAK
jgi:tetratricopeptide (TPR) repeat protein